MLGIADDLLDGKVISNEQYGKVCGAPNSPDKMRVRLGAVCVQQGMQQNLHSAKHSKIMKIF